jgi:hypothetical protein
METENEVIVVLTPEQAKALLDALPTAGYGVLGSAIAQIEIAMDPPDA